MDNAKQNVTCSKKKLSQIFTDASPADLDKFYTVFDEYARDARVDAEVNENFLLAQIQAESGNPLKSVRENLNYSCDALESEFSYYGERHSEATADGRCDGHDANQTNIGNKAYADRIGNGDVASGDGYMFRGGGYIQITGRANYQMVATNIQSLTGKPISAEECANKITDPAYGLLAALAFWYDEKMYDCTDIDCCTKIVDPNTDTYDERHDFYEAIAAIPAAGN
jgi:putative chitinase